MSNDLKHFINHTAWNATNSGYRPIPVYEGGTTAPFKNDLRYDNYLNTEWSVNWQGVPIQHVALALDDCILVDYDGNKAGDDIISLEILAIQLRITYEELLTAQVQSNVTGDSLHFLFRVEDQVTVDAIRSKTGFKMSNDGKWIQHIDVKTGNQLMHLKMGKVLTLPNRLELCTAPPALIDTLRVKESTHVVGEYAVCEIEDPSAVAWLAQDCAELAAMVDGDGRNGQNNINCMLHIGRVLGGFLDETRTRQALSTAARTCGLTDTEITGTFDSVDSSVKPASSVTTHPDVKRQQAVALMMSQPVEGEQVVTVNDMYAGKVAIDLAWQIKNAMERIANSINLGEGHEPFEITVNPEVIEKIITRSQWVSSQNKLNVLSDENTFNTYSEKDMFNLLKKHFGQVWITEDVEAISQGIQLALHDPALAEKTIKKLIAVGTGEIVDHLKMMNQRRRMNVRVDMFTDRPRMDWEPEIVTVVMTWRPIVVSTAEPRPDVIADYKQHFPQLDELLDQIIASRFASNRKNFFTWLHCESDWGKGLFTSLLTELGVCVELSVTECEKAFEGAPLGRDGSEFYRAFVLLFDEFKNVKRELKQLENSIPITPKNQMRQGVELFTKMFTSAEFVDSLVGTNGVEDQFANRFSYMNCKGSIKKREMFNGVGRKVYACAVRDYIGQYMNKCIDEYISMGEVDATRKADDFGDEFHKRNGIDSTFERLSDSIPKMVEEFKRWCVANHSTGFNGAMGNCVKSGDHYYLKSSAKMYSDWVAETSTRSELATIGQKKNEVLIGMCSDGVGIKNHRLDGTPTKCVKFNIEVRT
jgi:hypothetical protein